MHVELIDQPHRRGDEMRELLLLADEQWENVEAYLDRADLYALVEGDELLAECCLTDEGGGLAEVQNLAVSPARQHQGLGAYLLSYALRRCRGRHARLRVRTGDSPLTVPFYERCGFVQVERLEGDILRRYDHPIFEAGMRLTDTVVLEQEVPAARKPTRVFTSDLHLGDRSVARWRSFARVEEHDALVLANLEECLLPGDELWILGDVCRPRVEDARRLRRCLPCDHVHVIVGNHDTRAKFVTAGGYDTVDYYAHVGKVRREGYRFVLSHYPMLDWDRAYHGSYMLHGHIHSLPAERANRACGGPVPADRNHGGMGMAGYNEAMAAAGTRRFDVGLDANGMRPVTAEQIIAVLPDDATWTAMHGLPVD